MQVGRDQLWLILESEEQGSDSTQPSASASRGCSSSHVPHVGDTDAVRPVVLLWRPAVVLIVKWVQVSLAAHVRRGHLGQAGGRGWGVSARVAGGRQLVAGYRGASFQRTTSTGSKLQLCNTPAPPRARPLLCSLTWPRPAPPDRPAAAGSQTPAAHSRTRTREGKGWWIGRAATSSHRLSDALQQVAAAYSSPLRS